MLLAIVDGLIVVAISAYTIYTIVYIFVVWCTRHNFFIAMR